MTAPTCDRCGSRRLRRARTRSEWQRLVRRLTPLHRYACGDCGGRGWTTHPLERDKAAEGQAQTPTPARPLERRDLRATRGFRLRLALTVAFALGLGACVAYLLSGGSAE